tara:strand:- start:121 stop:696 length:576 start_codon:yes stop_codon:yes gene_type:complete
VPLGAARFGLSGVKAEDLVLIQTQSPSGVADIDFTSISEDKYNVHFVTYTLKPASDNETLGCRFFESGTIESSSVYVEGHMETLSQGNNEDSNAQIHYRSTGRDHIRVGENTGNSTGEGGSGYFYIHNAGDSNLMTSLTNQNTGLNNSNNLLRAHGGGTLPQTSTVDGFRIFGKNNGGNLTGKVSLYGVSI